MTKHLTEIERKSQILRAARGVFIEKGFVMARVEDVAKRAGLSKGAVYFYFESKRELFLALVREEHDYTYAFLEEAEDDERPALVRLLSLGQKYSDYLAGLKSPPRFFLMMCEMGIRDEEIRVQCQEVHHRFVDATRRILEQGMEDGSIRKTNALAVAQALKALVDGLAGQSAIGVRPDTEGLLSHGVDMIWHGILPGEK